MVELDAMVKVMLTTFAEYGVVYDNVINENDHITFYITIPEESELLNVDGLPMANDLLAKRFRQALVDMVTTYDIKKDIIVKYKIAREIHWNESMRAIAKNNRWEGQACLLTRMLKS